MNSAQLLKQLELIREKTKWSNLALCNELNKKEKIIHPCVMSLVLHGHRNATLRQELAINKLYSKTMRRK